MSFRTSIQVVLTLSLLIILTPSSVFGQINDTIYLDKTSFKNKLIYNAQDSFYIDLKQKQVHLYNHARVFAEGIELEAGYIMIDLNKKEVYATYIFDKDSNSIQKPVFTDGADKIHAGAIRYNFNSKKGFIEEVNIQQDENYLYMDVAKKQDNNEVHFLRGRFTTCDLPEPHYHFQLTKAILIPEKRIVSGPMNLWIMGIPTPIGLPFAFFPQVEEKSKGIIFPQIVPTSVYGFGFQNLGYYIPINDRFQTTFYGSLYSRGTFGFQNMSEYKKRYKYEGNFTLGFQSFNSGFPQNRRNDKITVLWQHKMDRKANPYWNFNSLINFISDNNTKNNLDQLNTQYFNNTLRSDINLTRSFPGKPFSAGMKISLRQNSSSKTIALTSPKLNFNVNRFYPIKKLFKVQTRWNKIFAKIGMTYNFEAQNASTFQDTLITKSRFEDIGPTFQNGILQSATIQTTGGLFKNILKITPSVKYTNRMNFQQTRKSYDAVNNSTISDTVQEFGMHHDLSFNTTLTSALYSYYNFVGKNKTKLRHVLTPTVGFSYIPKLNKFIEDSVGVNQAPIIYSPFETSSYRTTSNQEQAIMRFGINNTFELKHKSKKDSITGVKKTRLIDAFSITGTYDFLKDSFNLSNINFNLRISPIPWMNFVGTSVLSPYDWNDSTGAVQSGYALVQRNKLGRLISNSLSTTLTFTSKESRDKIDSKLNNQQWDADFTYFALHPEVIVDYSIPWKISLSHIYTINMNLNRSATNPNKWNQIQTILLNGDVSFTKRWKLISTMNFDVETLKVTNARFTLSRDMHCWELGFNWIPIGLNQSFLFSVRSTSTLFRDAKINLRRPPDFL